MFKMAIAYGDAKEKELSVSVIDGAYSRVC